MKEFVLRMLHKFRWALYPLFFLFMFSLCLYWTFPIDIMRGFVVQQIEEALQKSSPHPAAAPPKVSIGSLSVWHLSGVRLDQVSFRLPGQDGRPGALWELENLKIRLGIFAALRGLQKIEFDSKLYGGRIYGGVQLSKKSALSDLVLVIDDLDLGRLTKAAGSGGLPIKGLVNLDTDLHFGSDPTDPSDGDFALHLKGMAVGPGQLPLPVPGMVGGITVPKILVGNFDGVIDVTKGRAKTKQLKLSGGDIELDANIGVDLHQDVWRSRLIGDGWFRIAPKFLDANPALKSMADFIPQLKAAKTPDGRYMFSLSGTLENPTPKFGKPAK